VIARAHRRFHEPGGIVEPDRPYRNRARSPARREATPHARRVALLSMVRPALDVLYPEDAEQWEREPRRRFKASPGS
jgi:hypothetical protein